MRARVRCRRVLQAPAPPPPAAPPTPPPLPLPPYPRSVARAALVSPHRIRHARVHLARRGGGACARRRQEARACERAVRTLAQANTHAHRRARMDDKEVEREQLEAARRAAGAVLAAMAADDTPGMRRLFDDVGAAGAGAGAAVGAASPPRRFREAGRCVRARTHARSLARSLARARKRTHTYTRARTQTRTRTDARVPTRARAYAHTDLHIHTPTHTPTHICHDILHRPHWQQRAGLGALAARGARGEGETRGCG